MATATLSAPQTARELGRPWPIAAAAEWLNVSESHLRRLARAGAIRLLRIGGRVLLADDDVRRLATEGLQ